MQMKSKLNLSTLVILAHAACGGPSHPAGATPAVAPHTLTCPNGTNAECTAPDTCDASTKTCFTAGGVVTTPTPTILSSSPTSGASDVALNASIAVTFSEAMDPATLDTSSFTLTAGATAIAGTVTYANAIVTFWPAAHLASGSSFTATVTTVAKSAAGVALASSHTWTFATGSTLAAGVSVDLGTAGNFVILAKSGISTVPTSAVTGNIGLSPAAASYITGFPLSPDTSNVFSTTPQVTGKVYAADYAVPTPANLTTAVSDMMLAFTDAAGRAPDVTELGAGDIGGMTLNAGVYKWGTGLNIPTNVTLSGSATAVWIFEIAQDLTVSSATSVLLTGGALSKNIFWQVSGLVDIGTTAHLEGVVLSETSATLRTGASINGRIFAQTAINIAGSTVTEPAL
jgi:hypothetical protein